MKMIVKQFWEILCKNKYNINLKNIGTQYIYK